MPRVLVIGIGTRQGEDAVGLRVVERLARSALPAGARLATCERPLDLVELLDAGAVVLVDAVCSGAAPGTLHELRSGDLAREPGLSTHALGVAEALALAEALGRAPAHLELVGIEVTPPATVRIDGGISPAVERAVAAATGRIRERIEALADPVRAAQASATRSVGPA